MINITEQLYKEAFLTMVEFCKYHRLWDDDYRDLDPVEYTDKHSNASRETFDMIKGKFIGWGDEE